MKRFLIGLAIVSSQVAVEAKELCCPQIPEPTSSINAGYYDGAEAYTFMDSSCRIVTVPKQEIQRVVTPMIAQVHELWINCSAANPGKFRGINMCRSSCYDHESMLQSLIARSAE